VLTDDLKPRIIDAIFFYFAPNSFCILFPLETQGIASPSMGEAYTFSSLSHLKVPLLCYLTYLVKGWGWSNFIQNSTFKIQNFSDR